MRGCCCCYYLSFAEVSSAMLLEPSILMLMGTFKIPPARATSYLGRCFVCPAILMMPCLNLVVSHRHYMSKCPLTVAQNVVVGGRACNAVRACGCPIDPPISWSCSTRCSCSSIKSSSSEYLCVGFVYYCWGWCEVDKFRVRSFYTHSGFLELWTLRRLCLWHLIQL